MTAAEFAAARARMNVSALDLALSLDLPPQVVAAYEDGSLAIPAKTAGEMTWRVATLDRIEALAGSGLPACAWLDNWNAEASTAKQSDASRRMIALSKHVAACPTCAAREKFLQDRFGPMPERPLTGWMGIVAAIGKQVDRLPPWMRSGTRGALLFLAYSTLKLVLMLPRISHAPAGSWMLILGAFGISAAMGFAVGSLVGLFSYVRDRVRAPAATP